MPKDQTDDQQWDELVTELHGAEDEQREPWGGADEILIARYLANECDPQEREVVERAARSSPEVRECIELAREALADAPTEKTVLAAERPSRQSSFRRVLHGVSHIAARNWAVAASLLIVLVGGALMLAHINTESATALAKVQKLQESQESWEKVAGQLEVKTPEELREKMEAMAADNKRQLAAFRAAEEEEKEAVACLRELNAGKVAGLETDIGLLRKELRRLEAEKLGVETNALALKGTIRKLQSEFAMVKKQASDIRDSKFALRKIPEPTGWRSSEDTVDKVAAAEGGCSACRIPALNENRYVECRSLCVQAVPSECMSPPATCISPSTPCLNGYAATSQPSISQGYIVRSIPYTSYRYTSGWRPASEAGSPQASGTSPTIVHAAKPTFAGGARSGNTSCRSVQRATSNRGTPPKISERIVMQRVVDGTGLSSPGTSQPEATKYYAATKRVQETRYPAPTSLKPRPESTDRVVSDNGVWRASRD